MVEATTLDLVGDIRGSAIDVDNHYYEPDDCFTRHIEVKYRDLAFVPRGPANGRLWSMGDQACSFAPPGILTDIIMPAGAAAAALSGKMEIGALMGADEGPGRLQEGEGALPEGLVAISDYPEWLNRASRVKLMDEQGLGAIVILPSGSLMLHHDFRDRPDAVNANLRSFNRWLDEEWGFARSDGRIFAVPMLTLFDLDWAIEELEYVAGRGSRFIWLPHAPVNGKSPADPMFDPFWARVEEMGVKLIFHIGYEGFTDYYGAIWGEPGRYISQFSAFQHYLCWGERPISDSIAALVLHNLFGRFPALQLLTIENGSVWVGPLLRSMDKAVKLGSNGEWLGGRLSDLPSDIFRNHVYVNPYHEEDLVELTGIVGTERVLFGSDYPHPEGLADPLVYAQSVADRFSRNDFLRIMRDNAASLLRVP